VEVTAFPVRHGSCPHALGYRFASAGRVVVVSGDTASCQEVELQAQGADVLVHEVYSEARLATRPPEWQRYHRAFHTSSVEVAALASAAGVHLLVLTHLLLWGARPEDLLAEVRAAGYEGDLVCGADLDCFDAGAVAPARD
jgi:ribonuclease BN (tRNA processing enzyme)